MSARVFISYRTSDGADKATALARDLDTLFGDEQIFLDKDDLTGGSRWRDVIRQALNAKPVLLVLVTPQYLEARDAQGRRRIELAEDPVREELAAAIAAGADLIPILCDGVPEVPNVASLPRPLNELGERTWRRLRTYDWRDDVARLASDLRHLGLQGRPGTATAPLPLAAPLAPTTRRRAALIATSGALLLAAAGGGWWCWQRPSASNLDGDWIARLGARGANNVRDGKRMRFRIEQTGLQLRVVSVPVPIAEDPAWADYRKFWRERFNKDLNHVVYRGEGTLRLDPGQPAAVNVPMRIEAAASQEQVDGGQLSAVVDDEGLRLRGKLWLNSEQADRVIELRRGKP